MGDVCKRCFAIERQEYVSCWGRSLRKSEHIYFRHIYLKFVHFVIMGI